MLDIRLGRHYAARLWVNHPGEDRPDGVHRPSYWAGNGRLPHVMQHRNRAWMIFDLQHDLRRWTHLYLPRTALDEVVVVAHWCFVRGGNGYAALHNPAGLQTHTPDGGQPDSELRAFGEHNVWYIAVDSGQGAADFPAFIERFRHRQAQRSDDGAARFDDPDYGLMTWHPASGFAVNHHPFAFPDTVSVIPERTEEDR
ncbi:hypothetical protein [Dickeya dadantii]|uniref:hypothetical protein n=1 Tax=Dickeya dadantii TaxID=204038 RepID=UPI0020A63E6E|nr:hypothetical protein [Dickeya dadantii]